MSDQPPPGPVYPQPPEPGDYPPPYREGTLPPAPVPTGFGPPPFSHQTKPVGAVGMGAAVLIGVVVVLSAVSAWSDWHRYTVASDYVSGRGSVTLDDLDSVDNIAQATAIAYLIGLIAAGVVFTVWLWRARQNAEILCFTPHRRARAWVVWGWICPGANLWFPFMVVDDVYRASRPDNPRDLADLRSVPGSAVLGWWWALWLGLWVINRLGSVDLGTNPTIDDFRTYAVFSAIETLVAAAAAVLIIRVMREISAWQAPRWPN